MIVWAAGGATKKSNAHATVGGVESVCASTSTALVAKSCTTRGTCMKKKKVNEDWLAAVADELRDEGCEEEFIECTLDELRDGENVTVTIEKADPARATITRNRRPT